MKIKYIVKKEEGKVIAMFDRDGEGNPMIDGIMGELCDHASIGTVTATLGMLDGRLPYLPDDFASLRGVATCQEGDVFDEKVGRDIAGGKLMAKYHARMARGYGMAIQEAKRVIADLEKLEAHHERKTERITEAYQKRGCEND